MAISKERMDRFTSEPDDFVIIKPAPKKKGKDNSKAKESKGKPAKKK